MVMSAGDVPDGAGPAAGMVGNLMSVRYLIASDSVLTGSGDPSSSKHRLVYDEDMYVYENTAALPKGICIDRDLIGTEFLRRGPGGGPPTLYLSDKVDRLASYVCGRCEIRCYEGERVELDVHADRDCFLLFQDTFYPGWVGYVDGMKQPILRTDLGFRAMQLARGDHHVAMAFRPMSLKFGLGLTCLGIIVGIVYARKARDW
jgi:hypothetical protein